MKALVISLSFLGVFLLLAVIAAVTYISYTNSEVRLRSQAEAVQTNNKNEFDLMWKKISQVVQVGKTRQQARNAAAGIAQGVA